MDYAYKSAIGLIAILLIKATDPGLFATVSAAAHVALIVGSAAFVCWFVYALFVVFFTD